MRVGAEVVKGLYDMPRPFTKLKALSIEDLADEVVGAL